MKIIFFGIDRSTSERQMGDIHSFTILASKTRDFGPRWETTFASSLDEVNYLEEQLKNLPTISITKI